MAAHKPTYRITPVRDLNQWDEALQGHHQVTAFHSSQWGCLLQEHFPQLKLLPAEIFRGSDLIGALPCYLFRPVPLLTMMHSSHWNLPGGPLIWDTKGFDPIEFTWAMTAFFAQIARQYHLTEVLLHTSPFGANLDAEQLEQSGFEPYQERFTHSLDIREGRDAVWAAYNKRVRGAVRKAAKSDVTVSISNSEERMQEFYAMYLSMMRHFGSPPKPYGLLRALQLGAIGHLVVAEHEGQLIGGLLFLHFGRSVTLWVEATLPEFLHLRTNNALIDFIVAWACEHDYEWVDFGASPPERRGLVTFKEEWRAKRHDFVTYRWICSRLRHRLWEQMEPPLRTAYGWLQRRNTSGSEIDLDE